MEISILKMSHLLTLFIQRFEKLVQTGGGGGGQIPSSPIYLRFPSLKQNQNLHSHKTFHMEIFRSFDNNDLKLMS